MLDRYLATSGCVRQMQPVRTAQREFRQAEIAFPMATENYELQVFVLKGGMIEQAPAAAHQEHTPPSRSGTRSRVGFIGGLYRTAE